MSEQQVSAAKSGATNADGLYENRWKALTVVLLAVFVDLLDISIVNVAIPEIQRDLGASYSAIQWVLAGYALTFALTLITGGRLGDIHGRDRVFIAGMAIFTVASLICGVAQSPGMLVAGRLLQGVGAGVMMPQVLSLIQVMFPAHERAKAFGMYGGVAGLATVSGPLAGALLTHADIAGLDWRPIFLVNIFVGAAAIAAAIKLLPNSKAPHPLRLDFGGIAILSLALLAVFLPLIQGREAGWPAWTWISLGAAPVFLLAFIWFEKSRKDSPLVELHLFKEKSFTAGTFIVALLLGCIGSYFLIYTVSLQIGLGFSVLMVGMTGLPYSLGSAIGSGMGAQLAPKVGRKLLAIGVVLSAAGMLALAWTVERYEATLDVWQLYPSLFVSGIGLGFIIVPLSDFTLAKVAHRDAGSAAGVFATFQQLGSAAGIAVIGVLFFGTLSSHAMTSAQQAESQISRDLVAAGIPSSVASEIGNSFSECFEDRASEKDPNVVPPSCQTQGGNSTVANALTVATESALADNFSHAWKVSLLWISAVHLVILGLVFLLPRKVEHRDDIMV